MDVQKWLMTAAIIAVFGGIVSYILSTILPTGDTLVSTIISVIMAIVFLLYLTKTEGVAYLEKIPTFVAFLVLVGAVGSLVAVFMPSLSPYFLSVNNFSLSGLLYTLFYVGVGSMIAEKLGVL